MRIVFVTTDDLSLVAVDEVDRPFHEASFARAGIELEYRPWSQRSDWAAYDLVVIRSPWDYPDRTPEFLTWLDSVEHLPTLMNPAPLIRWNLDKRYLAELGAAGVPVVPTGFATSMRTVDSLLAAQADRAANAPEEHRADVRQSQIRAAETPAAEIVVKPAISAGSRNTGRFIVGDPAARDLAETILSTGGTVMVQPAVASVAVDGEVGVVVFDGEISHAIVKAPILDVGGTLLGGGSTETVRRAELTPAQQEATMSAVEQVESFAVHRAWFDEAEPLLYGRYDLVRMEDGTEALLEAELFEPSFFLQVDPDSSDRFVEVVRRRAEAIAARR